MMILRHCGHLFQIANQAAQQAPAALVPELESGPKLKTASGSWDICALEVDMLRAFNFKGLLQELPPPSS